MMSKRLLPTYPIYIPSKGRAVSNLTAKMFKKDAVSFRLVVEPQEADEYAEHHGEENILVLPFSDLGSVIPARNWIKEHSIANGDKRHWQIDDNIRLMRRWWKNKRLACQSGPALAIAETFTDRYENIAFTGLEYTFFAVTKRTPIIINTRVYS